MSLIVSYEGTFMNGWPHGVCKFCVCSLEYLVYIIYLIGVTTWSSGNRREGDYKDGSRHGKVTYYFK